MEKFTLKNCIKCNVEFKNFRKQRNLCEHCRCLIICPVCKEERKLSNESNAALSKDKPCAKCSLQMLNEKQKGENNPFFGKKHTEESKSKQGKKIWTDEDRQKSRELLKLVANKKHPFTVWESKYDKETVDIKKQEYRNKISKLTSGELNPMFGKPSPQGSGNGWSGWYFDIYFRSILELSYLKYLLDNGIKFESGELDKHKIKYFDSIKNKYRNYFPDYYLIDSKIYIEIKPKKLINSGLNLDKFNVAKNLFGENFKIITENDIQRLSEIEIKNMYNDGSLKWLPKYDKKFNKL